MSPVRTHGCLFEALTGHVDGRPARLCRNGWPRVLALILLAGLVATVPLDYVGPADLTRIADIYDAVECDDTDDVDRDRVITHAQPVGVPVPTVATDARLVVGPLFAISVAVAVSTIALVEYRVRPPPHRCDHRRVLSPLSSPSVLGTLRSSRVLNSHICAATTRRCAVIVSDVRGRQKSSKR